MHREPGTKARCFAVVNQKGGVGKSTTVVNVASWLALDGAKVLIVDLDPQANATTGVGIDHHRVPGNIYQILVDDKPLEDAIEASAIKDLYCVPSTLDLAGAEIELVPAFSRELKLRKALEPVAFDFDYIFIDCPPSLGILTVNALAAASELIVPIQCEYYALEGLSQLMKNTSLVQSNLNPTLDLFGILLTMYDSRTKLAEQVAAEVRSHFPGKVFTASIPRSVRLSEAPSHGLPIALYDARSKGSLAYHSVAKEVARGIGTERSVPEAAETPPVTTPSVPEADEAPPPATPTNVPEIDARLAPGPIKPNGSVDLTKTPTEEAPEHQRSPATSAPNAEGGPF